MLTANLVDNISKSLSEVDELLPDFILKHLSVFFEHFVSVRCRERQLLVVIHFLETVPKALLEARKTLVPLFGNFHIFL